MAEYRIEIPNTGRFMFRHLVLDLNGTVNFYGKRPPGLKKYLKDISKFLDIYILSADTRGDLKFIAAELGVTPVKISGSSESKAKADFVNKLGADGTIYMGNGNNDAEALKAAALGICVIGSEGASTKALISADIAVVDPIHALKLILDGAALKATLRK